ncbi:3',5'-cyclic AMP phosphodiesterase CpdA [Acidovorax sp. 62]|uniref:metallophosphoesterase n=1 Tax=Acidovorax sp. 62 TaxID=2035203 RepID=UPI000C6A031A|nr:metallophosphoesterase [Acidovorax sp. 62]PIF90243.1 3',5'-cyclic AMP phosphodiesterase CpdA [Acidovorax sp. 62]
MSIDHKRILTAFQPAKEISDPKRFAGRRQELEAGAELIAAKNHVFIYGPRGIGKSSLARQLEIIAKGNPELLEEINSPLKDMQFSFATCFLTRDESVNNINQLLYRLMIDDTGFGKFDSLFSKFGEVQKYAQGAQLDAKLVADFWRRAKAIAGSSQDGLIIFIDEFELIQTHEGFSSLLKAAPDGVVFAVTGIATTERELVRDHLSIERQLTTGKLPVSPMAPNELLRVVATAEGLIKHEILYSDEAKTELIRIVAGQPYLLHLIGRESLLNAFRSKKKVISLTDLNFALSEIALRRTDSVLEDQYLKAIGNSNQREIVLRAFAATCSPNAHTSQAYPIAEGQGVTNVSYYVADLQKDSFGSSLRKVKEQVYSFRDSLFQAYVSATPRRLSHEKSDDPSPTLKRAAGQEFELLHFSDLHFGEAHYFSKLPSAQDSIPHEDKPSLDKFVGQTIEREHFRPNLIVFSGDLTQRGTSTEFNLAKTAISGILNSATENGSNPDIVLIPGNHDVNWALQEGDPDAGMAFQPYINFRNALITHSRIDVPISPERLYEVRQFESNGARVIVAAFNSAVLIKKGDDRGYIGTTQLDNALQEVSRLDPLNQFIRIAVFHHHLVPVHSGEATIRAEALLTDAPAVKQRLYKAKFIMALHGHRHQGHEEMVSDGENSLVVIGCGSSSVVVPERGSQPLQFNRIAIQLMKENVAIQVTKYYFDTAVEEWKAQPAKTFSVSKAHKE